MIVENQYPITRTKIIIPRRREQLLSRQRLLNMLEDLLEHKLIVVAAPAGYGKTSLLVDFANHSEWPIGWLSLDPLDKDPFRFLTHLIASVQQRYPKFSSNALNILNNTPQNKLDLFTVSSVLVNDIYDHIKEHFILIIDDFQFVEESEEINQIVNHLLLNLDENCHLIISSRRLLTLPDMPLLVARNDVGGISYEEIAFSVEEIQSLLLRNYQVNITEQSAEEICTITEGWITGLLLSTQLLEEEIKERMRVERVSGVGLYDYLVQQVFDKQPDQVKEFLLLTSLLDDFNLELCEQVINKALNISLPWGSLMDEVVRRNLFVQQVSEENRVWLRYHHLFRDFLQNLMNQTRPEESKTVILSLGDNFLEKGNWDLAFESYQKVHAIDRLVKLVKFAGSEMVTRGKVLTLQEWLGFLPPEIVNSNPVFLSLRGAILVNSGEVSQGIILFSKVIERFDENEENQETYLLTLTRRAASYTIKGDYEHSLNDSIRALALLEDLPEFGRLQAEAKRNLGLTYYYMGDLTQALSVLKQSLSIFESYKDEQNIPRVLFNIALLHKVMGDYDISESMYQKALAYWQAGGNLVWLADSYNNLGVIQQQRGDYIQAASNFEKAIELSQICNSPRTEGISLASLGDLYRDMDAFKEAIDVYSKARVLAKQTNFGYLLFYLDLAEGVLNRLSGKMQKAKTSFDLVEEKAKESKSAYNQNLFYSEKAMFLLRSGTYSKAFELANQAYQYFEQEGHKVESHRAAFSCALSSIAMGNLSEGYTYLGKIPPIFIEDKYSIPLIIQARAYKGILHSVKGRGELRSLISRILDRIRIYEKGLLSVRKKVREQAKIVPFEPPHMSIQAFGKAQVFLTSKLVTNSDWQTQASKDLFFLLIAYPNGLTKEQAGLNYWPDATSEELKLRFKNTLYRLRRAVGRETILLEEDYYLFNRSLDYEYDAEKFVQLIELSRTAKSSQEKKMLLKSAVEIYKGDYLPEVDGIWVIAPRRRYHQLYIESLLQLGRIYMEQRAYKPALQYCFQALSQDACLEEAHRLLMKIHAAMGNRVEIMRQYDNCCLALQEEINAYPSRQTTELYETLMKN